MGPESVCAVLREQGCQVAARTYRAWRSARPAARTISDALVVEAIREAAWTTKIHADGTAERVMTPEGLYGRRKMTAHLRRQGLVPATPGAVDRGMRLLGLVGVRRDKGVRTTIPAKDGIRAGDLLNRACAGRLTYVSRPSARRTRGILGDAADLGHDVRCRAARPLAAVTRPGDEPESDAAKFARLETELAGERAEALTLGIERDILRSAAKYFAVETRR